MGLDTTHDAFHGAYSAFNRLRQMICRAAGGSFPPHDPARLKELDIEDPKPSWWYVDDDITEEKYPGLYAFLKHSDCDGSFTPAECLQVADDLEKLLPKIAEMDDGDVSGGVSFTKEEGGIAVARHPGHLSRVGGYTGATQKFIDGCRLAASRGETLEFR